MTIYEYKNKLVSEINSVARKSIDLKNRIAKLEEGHAGEIIIAQVQGNTVEEQIADFKEEINYWNNYNANEEEAQLQLVNQFIEIVESEKLTVSKSPYSNSFYAHQENEEISWNGKPQNSYRLADHWNFDGHCRLNTSIDDKTVNEIMLCKFEGTSYRRI